MRRLAGAVVALALVHATGASAAQTIDAGAPTAGPVLVPGGVAWADAGDPAPALRVGGGDAPPRTLVTLPRGDALSDLSAAGGGIAYTAAAGAPPSSTAFAIALAGGPPAPLLRCDPGRGAPAAVLGDGFTVLRGCGGTASVTIDGALVGSGSTIAAAGAFAAWSAGPTVTVARATPAVSILGALPAAGAWALAPDGSVVTAAPGVRTTTLAASTPDGATAPIGEEPGGVFGLGAGAGGTIAFATQAADGAQAIVVRRGGERVEVARFWPDPATPPAVATDGTRVAWFSARCGGTDLTVAAIGEPGLDQRAAPCPVEIAGQGALRRTIVAPAMRCDVRVAPQPCTARVRVRARGRVIADGVVALTARAGGPVPLTAAGRRLVAGQRRVRAQVEVVRPVAGGAPLTTRRTVLFVRRGRA